MTGWLLHPKFKHLIVVSTEELEAISQCVTVRLIGKDGDCTLYPIWGDNHRLPQMGLWSP